MKISKRRIRKAKKLLAKIEEQERKKEEARLVKRNAEIEEYKKQKAIISKHRDKLVEVIVKKFEVENEPRFEVGEEVRINPYTHGNHWEGSLAGYLRGCDKYQGPIIVKVIKVYTDKSYLYEVLEKMEERQYEILEGIKENDFSKYLRAWESYTLSSSLELVDYSYFVEYEGENLTERYRAGFRQPNFIKLGSELEELTLKAYDFELQEKELDNQRVEICRKKWRIDKKRNEMAKKHPYLGLTYICNLPETEDEAIKKGWI